MSILPKKTRLVGVRPPPWYSIKKISCRLRKSTKPLSHPYTAAL
jgi:hypothetical protein